MNEYQAVGFVLIFGGLLFGIFVRLAEIRYELRYLRVLELSKMDGGFYLTDSETDMITSRLNKALEEDSKRRKIEG